jgi:hypothetical protein
MEPNKIAVYNHVDDTIDEHEATTIFVSVPVKFPCSNFLAGPMIEYRLHELTDVRDVDGRLVLFVKPLAHDDKRPDGPKFDGDQFAEGDYYGLTVNQVLNALADNSCDFPSGLGCIGLSHLWEVNDHDADIVEHSETGVSGWDYMHPTERAAERVLAYIKANQIDDPTWLEDLDDAEFIRNFPLGWDT